MAHADSIRGLSTYRVVQELGSSATSEILEAVVESTGGFERRVAVKRLLAHLDRDDPTARAYLDEARILSRLDHPNIVKVLDFGIQDERPFLVMELIDGLDLSRALIEAKRRRMQIPIEIALYITMEIALALEHAHAAKDTEGRSLNIVHRDVTPSNILLARSGSVHLTDFGIAVADDLTRMTEVGFAKGTWGYLAPEQKRGIVDRRTDIFALGCVLHEMMTGAPPPDAPREQTRQSTLDASHPEDVRSLVVRAIETEPDSRYQDAGAMSSDCWKALNARLKEDGRRALSRWLSELSAAREPPAQSRGVAWMFAGFEEPAAQQTGQKRHKTELAAALDDESGLPTVAAPVEPEQQHTEVTNATWHDETKTAPASAADLEAPTNPLTQRRGAPSFVGIDETARNVTNVDPTAVRPQPKRRDTGIWLAAGSLLAVVVLTAGTLLVLERSPEAPAETPRTADVQPVKPRVATGVVEAAVESSSEEPDDETPPTDETAEVSKSAIEEESTPRRRARRRKPQPPEPKAEVEPLVPEPKKQKPAKELTTEQLQSGLTAINKLLFKASKQDVPQTRLKAFEDRYFQLREEVDGAPRSPSEQTWTKIQQLRRDLESTLR